MTDKASAPERVSDAGLIDSARIQLQSALRLAKRDLSDLVSVPLSAAELRALVDLLQERRAAHPREGALEEAAKVAEKAIPASGRVRDAMAPESPMAGLENALHGIVITTARGIARNIRALKSKEPWFAAEDEARDAPAHAGSGLAMVDTGRQSDWPIARLTEWHSARFIAASREAVPALLDEVERQSKRIQDWFAAKGVGTGDDPIGFLFASHDYAIHERNEARAEVERLRAERDEAKRDREFWCNDAVEKLAVLSAERDRLRGALEKIDERRYQDRYTVTPEMAWEEFVKANTELCAIYDEARAALTPGTPSK